MAGRRIKRLLAASLALAAAIGVAGYLSLQAPYRGFTDEVILEIPRGSGNLDSVDLQRFNEKTIPRNRKGIFSDACVFLPQQQISIWVTQMRCAERN